MVKTTKGGKVMNPTDSYRKELRKKELIRNKKERKKVREVGILKKDPGVIKDQIQKLELMKADGALDKARKHKKRQLEDTLNLVMKKRKEYEEKMKEKGEAPVMFSHLGPPRRTSAEEEERAMHPKPEDSVYHHPTLNPTGAPPPGKPPMYKSSIGPRIPLPGDSSGAGASSSRTEPEDADLGVPPPPPPLPENASGDGSVIPASLPLPPPPPMPPNPAAIGMSISLPPPPLPPPPPGPPPKDQVPNHTLLPLPPPLQHSVQPPPPGRGEGENERNPSIVSNEQSSKETVQPPPPGILVRLANSQSEDAAPDTNANVLPPNTDDMKTLPPPPPPPRQQPQAPGPSFVPSLQPDILPPGISCFPPPPPPPNMRPPLSALGLPGPMTTPGTVAPLIPRPPYGLPPGPPTMFRPPLPPGPPPLLLDDANNRAPVPLKPSYVKSAASTVVKRPLAQHNPELTSMVPASVRVRRETAAAKPKPKSTPFTSGATTKPSVPFISKAEKAISSTSQKNQSIDDSYTAFLEDMEALGALDG